MIYIGGRYKGTPAENGVWFEVVVEGIDDNLVKYRITDTNFHSPGIIGTINLRHRENFTKHYREVEKHLNKISMNYTI